MKHFGSTSGLTVLAEDQATPANGMVAYVTSSYNSGYQNGAIKLAALADTTAETLSGSELVVDGSGNWVGDFDVAADVSEWDLQNSATASVVSGELEVVWNATSSQVRYYLAQGTLPNGVYAISVDAYRGTAASYDVRIGDNLSTTTYGSAIAQTNTSKTTHVFYANVTNGYMAIFLRVNGNAAGQTAYFDNISVRLADPDRSVNGKGLAVYGSITKAPVATGADLVGYSGFDSSNYLEQPYNADLNFGAYDPEVEGSGDFCVMGWVKTTNSYQALASRFDSNGTSGNGWWIDRSGSNELRFRNYISGSFTNITAGTILSNVWSCLAVLRRNGVLYLYIDGNEVGNQAFTDTVSHTNSVLYVGMRNDAGTTSAFMPNVTLFRISATAPTADQIAKIYNDERPLFQPNAKATLTGSSDAVTALAHDPDTELLHVGTSGGRSVFQGLRRVEEHTGTNSQSLAAISAVDGLVVEGK